MNSKELNSYLNAPNDIGVSDLSNLKVLVDKYPYSALFKALYAKGLHNAGDLTFDDALRSAAIVSSDRSFLYALIYKEKLKGQIANISKTIDQDQTEETPKVDTIEPDEVIEVIPDLSEEINDEFVPEVVLEENELSDEEKELEEGVILEAINTSIQLDVDELLEQQKNELVEGNALTSTEDLNFEDTTEKTPQKFSDWLFAMRTDEDIVDEPIDDDKKALLSPQDLIDRFINTKSKKINVSKEPVTPQEMGKLSLVENEAFVTETLASIYAKQGKYDKAIKIYEQLSLKNPEKKVFFASRIRFLKEKMEFDN